MKKEKLVAHSLIQLGFLFCIAVVGLVALSKDYHPIEYVVFIIVLLLAILMSYKSFLWVQALDIENIKNLDFEFKGTIDDKQKFGDDERFDYFLIIKPNDLEEYLRKAHSINKMIHHSQELNLSRFNHKDRYPVKVNKSEYLSKNLGDTIYIDFKKGLRDQYSFVEEKD